MTRQISGTTPKHELEITAERIRQYWASRGALVSVRVVAVKTSKGTVYEIKSTGIPVRGK